MQLLHATIENFKGIRHLDVAIRQGLDGAPRPITVITGDNGSGKTTALQAIALTLALATHKIPSNPNLEAFGWYGFLPDRLGSQGPTQVRLTIRQSHEEIDATKALFDYWRQGLDPERQRKAQPPGDFEELELVFRDGRVDCTQGFAGLVQLWGRYYIKRLLKEQPSVREAFAQIGDVFWFDQYRNLGTTGKPDEDIPPESWRMGVVKLRDYLIRWWSYHTRADRNPERDFIARLEERFARVFPGTRFIGPEPSGLRDPDLYFLLERDGRRFEISELASGEQAAFALLYPFAYLDIHHSLILIDEVEMHLHPGTQQGLVRLLRRMAPTCQFLISTHSPFVADAFPDDQIRLPGGTPCL